ncbi:TOM1-like protein 5 [Vigna unguiculata]|uniref:TOM1-like protein 5 n=1 Tax=Vigna unguiculata TaxID=3917 RepID=UPI0010162106|nr:TOM1-like protein 5 [Vigna unguiculata]XP_027905163.1 TOM1-like protein 5 [Vigna unguiculata]XP_027905164.1 TOM1-like protein 5 [Vigna unguiculata]
MAAELVNGATSEKLAETDWAKNIEICELVAHDRRQARDVVKAIKKRLGSKHPDTQLYAVMLLEMLMNNIGEHIHEQVIDTGIIPILVKIVKKKSDLPVRERIFLLLDATQTSLGGASGKFPQYYNAYYELVSAGVQFSQRDQVVQSNHPSSQPSRTNNVPNREQAAPRHEAVAPQAESQTVPESSIIQKASNALEVLKEVLDAVDAQNPQGARDEFTLDLVEQCSFQKQRVMHLVMASRDERIVSRAIELNEQLQKVLTRHDDLLAGRTTATATRFNHEEAEEEEEPEQLVRRLRKGKACARPEDEETETDNPPLGLLGERLNRPLIRPLSIEPQSRHAETRSPPVVILPSPEADTRSPPVVIPPPPPRPKQNGDVSNHVAIPPPPAKHVEREKFFQENKDGSNLSGHMRGLSLHSRNGSSSHSGSFDFSE